MKFCFLRVHRIIYRMFAKKVFQRKKDGPAISLAAIHGKSE